MSYFEQTSVVFADGPTVDAFQRLRVAEPETLFDGKTLRDVQPLRFDDQATSGGGTSSTFSTNNASVILAVSNTTAGVRVRQSYRRFHYVPGKSQLAFLTFVAGTPTAGIKRKIGIFDAKNGVFLNINGASVGITSRTYVGGSANDTDTINQVDWNLDTLDGNGPSGIDLDFAKAQILVIDYEWLGVGRVRVGFNIDGKTYYAHEFVHANSLTTVWCSNPNLPIRYELENTGAGPAANLTCICSTVQSEGGRDPLGISMGVANAAIRTGLNGTGSTRYCLVAIRLASTAVETAIVLPVLASAICTTATDTFAWEIVLDPTIAGSPSWGSITNSPVEWVDGTSSNTVTGGTILLTGVGFAQSTLTIDPKDIRQLGGSIAGTSHVLALVIRPYANLSAVRALNWRELS